MTQHVSTLIENYIGPWRIQDLVIFWKTCVKATCLTQEPNISWDNACTCKKTNQEKKIENGPGSVWLYTRRFEKDEKNTAKLVEHSSWTGNPVTWLTCRWRSNRSQGEGAKSVIRNHFKNCSILLQTDICVGPLVAIEGIQIVPEAGLYNSTRGTVVDIVNDTVAGPPSQYEDHLPLYVGVNFPGLRLGHAKPWDKDNPTARRGKIKTLYGFILYIVMLTL